MIANASPTMLPRFGKVPRKPSEDLRLLDSLRVEAMAEVTDAFRGVSGKAIGLALVPGVTRHSISRAVNGCESNPLFRIAGWLVLMRRLGMGRAAALRWLEWFRQVVDVVWPPDEVPPLRDVLDREQEADGKDDGPQQRAYAGDRVAMQEWVRIKTAELAVVQEAVTAVRYHATVTTHF